MRSLSSAIEIGARRAWLWRHRDCFGRSSEGALPRLLVDVSTIIRHDAQTGIQRVVRAVWSELKQRHGREFELIPIFATSAHGYCCAPVDFLESGCPSGEAEAASAGPSDRFLGLDLSAHILPAYHQQLRSWRKAGASIHLLVYDLLPIVRPDFFNARTVGRFRRWFDVLAHEADQAICISRQVGRDLRERLWMADAGERPAISCIGLGGDIAASRPSIGMCGNLSRLLDRMRFRPAVLMVGTVEPRKAYDVALAAFEHLWASGRGDTPDMVIAGKSGWKTDELQARIRNHPEYGRRLYWLDRVSDEGLLKLYEACRGVLMASHAEGFGLPLLEAVTHRRRVLARDLPVFREQELPNVSYFEDGRPEVLGGRIMELVASSHEPAVLAMKLPTWSDCVEQLLAEIGLSFPVDGQFKTSSGRLRTCSQ
jgi:glycosyltransferase involved in cell wall biosynthesis